MLAQRLVVARQVAFGRSFAYPLASSPEPLALTATTYRAPASRFSHDIDENQNLLAAGHMQCRIPQTCLIVLIFPIRCCS